MKYYILSDIACHRSAAQGKVIIINAPFGSGSLWKVASLLLPPSTRAKVCICSSGYADQTPVTFE